jgi:putative spermidine/putrescine transport system permease protein
VEKERNGMETKTISPSPKPRSSRQVIIKPYSIRNVGRIWGAVLFYGCISFFIINLIALFGSVVVDSFGDHWFNSWLPEGGYSFQWYKFVGNQHDIGMLLSNTLFVAIFTTIIALLIGVPAAYILARYQFRFKNLLMGVYLIPMLVPPFAYGIPLATLLLRYLGSSLPSLVVINLVPVLPFVIMIMVPFIEQIDVSLEYASRILGANQLQTFIYVLLPLAIPGMLTAAILAIVRSVSAFDLTYLVADASSQTLVLSLFGDASSSGVTPMQAIDALSVVYMLTTMSLVVVALIFAKPTQFVMQIRSQHNL